MAGLIEALMVVLSLDQLSKAFVVQWLGEGQTAPSGPTSPLRLNRLDNARPGLARIGGNRLLLAAWPLLLCAALLPAFAAPIAQIGLGAALGGAAGNLLDRIRRGAVVDFIDVHVWPVFNVADAAIVVGLVVALLSARVAG